MKTVALSIVLETEDPARLGAFLARALSGYEDPTHPLTAEQLLEYLAFLLGPPHPADQPGDAPPATRLPEPGVYPARGWVEVLPRLD